MRSSAVRETAATRGAVRDRRYKAGGSGNEESAMAQTSYSGPNCRRNKSLKASNQTKAGRKTTELMYGSPAIQQVMQVMMVPTRSNAMNRTIPNSRYKTNEPGRVSINLATSMKASLATHRRRYISGTMN